ncbi:LDB19 domain-containing protein [Fusarium keratoplasticum]|uniref:LDB19 domain-containing protein n=1 Tax=Fusarium keratoplasticum TaxID=1328300 RepID=A0ACC0QIC8_9HYPO|nr:LDB19 domain-containing protein [Fusarium keratoplasticum]KAI8654675.1 LDB19 domain-containing protein [Fusarium keratoplasticum]
MSPWSPRRLLSTRQPNQTPSRRTNLKIELETPTAILHGYFNSTSDAYVSGRLLFNAEETIQVESLDVTLQLHVRYKRPWKKNCANCTQDLIQISQQSIISTLTPLPKGQHDFSMSFIIPSHLPISMDTPLSTVEYEVYAKALFTEQEPIITKKIFKVERILEAESNKQFHTYNFNSTNIIATLCLNSVIRPAGTNSVSIRIDNITSSLAIGLEVWKLHKVTWKLEESVSVALPNCPRHPTTPATSQGTSNDPTQQSETRLLGKRSLRHGWEEHTNESQPHITFSFDYSLNRAGPETIYACEESAGPQVTHALLVELHLEKHFVLPESPWMTSPPRAETTLRMTRPVVLTELVEPSVPPAYGNSADSPPEYADVSY